jgi:hypothetical protein
MGCEAHPDTKTVLYDCTGDLDRFPTPCFVEEMRDTLGRIVIHAHWNGDAAFQLQTDDQNGFHRSNDTREEAWS